jgi:hypothetical protein
MCPSGAPIGVILAGGAGRRMGGSKADKAGHAASSAGAAAADLPLRDAVVGLRPRLFEVEDPDALFDVNAPRTCFRRRRR